MLSILCDGEKRSEEEEELIYSGRGLLITYVEQSREQILAGEVQIDLAK